MNQVSNIVSHVLEGTKMNKVLTIGLFLSYGFTLKVLAKDAIGLAEFTIFFIIIAFVYKKLSAFSERAAFWLQDNVFVNKHNAKVFDKFTLNRFKGQMLQLATHLTGVLLELPTLVQEGWLGDYNRLWSPCPIEQTISHAIRIAYMFELAQYCYQGFAHRFLLVKNKDYYVMFSHHITTIILIAGSYYLSCFRVGLVVMFLHDFSDCFLDVNLGLNQAGMEGPEYLFATEILFVMTAFFWFLFRLVYLPKLIHNILISGHRMCALKHPGEPWKYPKCEGIPFYGVGIPCLSILVLMHAYWFYLMMLVAYNIITKKKTKKRGDVYEHEIEAKKND